jgi:hypothetical protein
MAGAVIGHIVICVFLSGLATIIYRRVRRRWSAQNSNMHTGSALEKLLTGKTPEAIYETLTQAVAFLIWLSQLRFYDDISEQLFQNI